MTTFPIASSLLLLLGIISVLVTLLFIPVDLRPEEQEENNNESAV
jgi:hypothetical protein